MMLYVSIGTRIAGGTNTQEANKDLELGTDVGDD